MLQINVWNKHFLEKTIWTKNVVSIIAIKEQNNGYNHSHIIEKMQSQL